MYVNSVPWVRIPLSPPTYFQSNRNAADTDTATEQGGTRIDSRPAEGRQAVSETAGDGSYHSRLSGSLLRGKAGEKGFHDLPVIDYLEPVLRAAEAGNGGYVCGRVAALVAGAASVR